MKEHWLNTMSAAACISCTCVVQMEGVRDFSNSAFLSEKLPKFRPAQVAFAMLLMATLIFACLNES